MLGHGSSQMLRVSLAMSRGLRASLPGLRGDAPCLAAWATRSAHPEYHILSPIKPKCFARQGPPCRLQWRACSSNDERRDAAAGKGVPAPPLTVAAPPSLAKTIVQFINSNVTPVALISALVLG